VEVRFHPRQQLWSYELASARNLNSAVLHNTAIVNRGTTPVVVGQVRFEVLRKDEVVLSRTLHATDLDAAAKGGHALAAARMFDLLKFQFSPDELFGGKPVLAATRTLAPGESLYLPHQVFAFPGRPDLVRITVDYEGATGDTVATLPLRHGTVAGHYRFPLHGRWVAGAGSTLHGHHRWVVPEEFAFDLVRYGASGSTYGGDGTRVTDYYAYAQPVFATADGEVVAKLDILPDNIAAMRRPGETLAHYMQRLLAGQDALLAAGTQAIAGNHVVVRHAEGVYSFYGHLRPGSVGVAAGDRVKAGQALGAVGTSGNSTEPHLHFHLCDAPDPLQCAGLPVAFDDVEIPVSEGPRQIQSGDLLETFAPTP
jgi:murein DD-endopeptidase MepM/ murein hydrolase activator NlpD